jgi:putative transposase
VTIVTYHRLPIFGDVVDDEMQLNRFGSIAYEEWFHTAILRSYVRLTPDEFIIMPNHIHGIIWIEENNRGAAALRPYQTNNHSNHGVSSTSLSAIVRAYKSAVTYRINALRKSRNCPVWQRNYYEHIIRNQTDMERIGLYINANPDQWADDPENFH